MIQNKYGDFSEEQFSAFKEKLHRWVHWCLVYAEEQSPTLDSYMVKVQRKFNGLNSILYYDSKIVEIMTLLEAARIEYQEKGCKTPSFRKFILDAHEIIDHV